jgi:hypothetical protein
MITLTRLIELTSILTFEQIAEKRAVATPNSQIPTPKMQNVAANGLRWTLGAGSWELTPAFSSSC